VADSSLLCYFTTGRFCTRIAKHGKHLLSYHTVCDGFSHYGLAFTTLLCSSQCLPSEAGYPRCGYLMFQDPFFEADTKAPTPAPTPVPMKPPTGPPTAIPSLAPAAPSARAAGLNCALI